jgi:hypothetical protein
VRQVWAESVAAGIDDALFWELTATETRTLLEALMRRDGERERSALLRAGLVAAAVYNVNRKKGARPLQPKDFVREPVRHLTPEQMDRALQAWASRVNGSANA